jgi:hypothetical protein
LSDQSDFRSVLGNGESLAHFLSAMKDFDSAFCDAMAGGSDFTLKLEIHGNAGKMLHARVQSDVFRRPTKNSEDSV